MLPGITKLKYWAISLTRLPRLAHLMPPPEETISRLMVTPYKGGAMVPPSTGFKVQTVKVRPAFVPRGSSWHDLVDEGSRYHMKNGGWMQIVTEAPATAELPVGGVAINAAVVYQLDFGGSGTNGKFDGVNFPGTWNNIAERQ